MTQDIFRDSGGYSSCNNGELNVSWLYELLEKSILKLAEVDAEFVWEILLAQFIQMSGARRGILVFFDRREQVLYRAMQHFDREETDLKDIQKIIFQVKNSGKPLAFQNFNGRQALIQLNNFKRDEYLKNIGGICIPLGYKYKKSGVVYLDAADDVFKCVAMELLEKFKGLAESIFCRVAGQLKNKQDIGPEGMFEEVLRADNQFDPIIGRHPRMLAVLRTIAQIANSDAPVVISGESGTGKELIARAVHDNSKRRKEAFVPINCGAMPENLLESELFGHVKGAFTGAVKDKFGWLEVGNNGSVFLDEVSEMPPSLQVRLLRVLQNGSYARVGSTKTRHSNIRVIAATNVKMKELIYSGRFREDLYYRLNVIEVVLPPLRERRSDILLLTRYFFEHFKKMYQKKQLSLSAEVKQSLMRYSFPGNVRELENMIHRAVVLAEGNMLYLQDCFSKSEQVENMGVFENAGENASFKDAKQRMIEKFERSYIVECLSASNGNINRAARSAGIHVTNFYGKMKKYNINPHSFKRIPGK